MEHRDGGDIPSTAEQELRDRSQTGIPQSGEPGKPERETPCHTDKCCCTQCLSKAPEACLDHSLPISFPVSSPPWFLQLFSPQFLPPCPSLTSPISQLSFPHLSKPHMPCTSAGFTLPSQPPEPLPRPLTLPVAVPTHCEPSAAPSRSRTPGAPCSVSHLPPPCPVPLTPLRSRRPGRAGAEPPALPRPSAGNSQSQRASLPEGPEGANRKAR